MDDIIKIVNIQKNIIIYKNNQVLFDYCINNYLNINIKKIITKYKKIFKKQLFKKYSNNYLLTMSDIILLCYFSKTTVNLRNVDILVRSFFLFNKFDNNTVDKIKIHNEKKQFT